MDEYKKGMIENEVKVILAITRGKTFIFNKGNLGNHRSGMSQR